MSPFGAFVFCELFGKIVALVGMVLLLRRHLTPNAPNIIIFGVALSFALLPFYPCMGLNVAGQPLLFYALLNFRDRDSAVHNWLIVGLFPFLSSLVLVGFFLIPGLAACLIYERLIRRKVVMALFACVALVDFGLCDCRVSPDISTLWREEFRFQPGGVHLGRFDADQHHQIYGAAFCLRRTSNRVRSIPRDSPGLFPDNVARVDPPQSQLASADL